jgi:2-succinyl-5-enolpyruvyl-6-hydroxy-3-cyclohexene-1-carboxylate synthase
LCIFNLTFAAVLSVYQSNINSIVSTLYQKGLRHVVICPGSRNAPLVMAFARFKKMTCYSVPDERVAGFVALGISKQLKSPAAVVCTSGTAVLNLYPAVAEAYYMQVPLLVITADRPYEMIGRWDGQTIHQFEVFKPHVLASFQTPENLDDDLKAEIAEMSALSYDVSLSQVQGPVHLNIPLKEPLYEAARLEFTYPEISLSLTDTQKTKDIQADTELPEIAPDKKILVLLGSGYEGIVHAGLESLSQSGSAVVVADVVSNAHGLQNIPNWEAVLLNASEDQKKSLSPDILITAGKMVLNKSVRQMLRKYTPSQHWHLAENGFSADTFFTGPDIVRQSPDRFFETLAAAAQYHDKTYYHTFRSLSAHQQEKENDVLSQAFNEFNAIRKIMELLPADLTLHLANSMSVRYVAYLGKYLKSTWKLYANRGVSGIDGCSSTAVGMAMVSQDLHVLITGDVAFYYDMNALWQQKLPENLRIILMNNFGGGIFRNIDGPADLPELDPYIGTPHQLKADHIARHFGVRYLSVSNEQELYQALPVFINGPGMAILEIMTDQDINSKIFKQYKSIVL